MPDYIPLITTPQAVLPRFPEKPDIASQEWVLDVVNNSISNALATIFIPPANYGGVAPTIIPTNSFGMTVDSSTNVVWVWNGITWLGI